MPPSSSRFSNCCADFSARCRWRCCSSPMMSASRSKSPIASLSCMRADRKSTRLNSSHLGISYAVFCLKKKRNNEDRRVGANNGESQLRLDKSVQNGISSRPPPERVTPQGHKDVSVHRTQLTHNTILHL